jgi:hypothetical protein
MQKDLLEELYTAQNQSMQQIADGLGCSLNKVDYWMRKYGIERRTRSDATYARHNPNGDPFTIKTRLTAKERELYGVGLGLYWGEGTKANPSSVRLGNSDPGIILKFIKFLEQIYGVSRQNMHFGMQLFTDCSFAEAIDYWTSILGVDKKQFYRPIRTVSGSIGTYRKKNQYGVVTLYFNNKRLRDILVEQINNMPR